MPSNAWGEKTDGTFHHVMALPLIAPHMIMLGMPKGAAPPARVVRRRVRQLAPGTIRLGAAVCEADSSGRRELSASVQNLGVLSRRRMVGHRPCEVAIAAVCGAGGFRGPW